MFTAPPSGGLRNRLCSCVAAKGHKFSKELRTFRPFGLWSEFECSEQREVRADANLVNKQRDNFGFGLLNLYQRRSSFLQTQRQQFKRVLSTQDGIRKINVQIHILLHLNNNKKPNRQTKALSFFRYDTCSAPSHGRSVKTQNQHGRWFLRSARWFWTGREIFHLKTQTGSFKRDCIQFTLQMYFIWIYLSILVYLLVYFSISKTVWSCFFPV